jgi:hypothetical protein
MSENQDLVFMASAALYSPANKELTLSNNQNVITIKVEPYLISLINSQLDSYEINGRKVTNHVGRLYFDRKAMKFVIKGVDT